MSGAPHIPVMLGEAVSALGMQAGGIYIDGTFGAGGYSREILQAQRVNLIAIDRDPAASAVAARFKAEFGARFGLYEGPFSEMAEAARTFTEDGMVDGVVLDIGVSSMQLDQAERGFSFMRSGPLDMRMSQSGPSAADAVNHLDGPQLTRIFQIYGEERRARRCADFIVQAREQGHIGTTEQLAEIIAKALGRGGKTHPATKVFQALRIYINDELGELCRALAAAEQILRPGGKLVIVTFHSLEDRIVKTFFRERCGETSSGSRHMPQIDLSGPAPSFTADRRSVVKPSKAELERNPRARSAKLRSAKRTDAPAWDADVSMGLRTVPSLLDLERVI